MTRLVFLLFACFVALTSAQAQTEPVGEYMFQDFQRGIGKMKRGLPIADNFNYDVVKEEMHFLSNGEEMLLVMPGLDTLTIDKRVFVPVGTKFAEYFRLENGVELKILWHSKQVATGREGAMGMSTQAGGVRNLRVSTFTGKHADQDYEQLKDLNTYRLEPCNTYIVTVKGKSSKFNNAKSFAKAFKLQKDEVEKLMEQNHWTFTNAQDIVKLLNSMEFK